MHIIPACLRTELEKALLSLSVIQLSPRIWVQGTFGTFAARGMAVNKKQWLTCALLAGRLVGLKLCGG